MIYISTPFSRSAADFLNDINVPAFKIGSGECDNLLLIEHIADFGKPIILSTGMQNLLSVEKPVEILERKNIFDYVNLGSDIPIFLNQKDSIVRGRGDLITNIIFPKYYFLLIKPNFICSTKIMYNSFSSSDFDYNPELDLEDINDHDNGNDFEKILKKIQPEFKTIYNYLEKLEGVIFTRLTGSGSCIFSVFEKKEDSENAKINFSNEFPSLWNVTTENNLLNIF